MLLCLIEHLLARSTFVSSPFLFCFFTISYLMYDAPFSSSCSSWLVSQASISWFSFLFFMRRVLRISGSSGIWNSDFLALLLLVFPLIRSRSNGSGSMKSLAPFCALFLAFTAFLWACLLFYISFLLSAASEPSSFFTLNSNWITVLAITDCFIDSTVIEGAAYSVEQTIFY